MCSFAEKLNTSVSFLIGENKNLSFSEIYGGNSIAPSEQENDLAYELRKIIDDGRNSVSIELLLVHVKDKLRRQEPPLKGHDRDAVVSLLYGCLELLKNEDVME